jgi:hypothetical protein
MKTILNKGDKTSSLKNSPLTLEGHRQYKGYKSIYSEQEQQAAHFLTQVCPITLQKTNPCAIISNVFQLLHFPFAIAAQIMLKYFVYRQNIVSTTIFEMTKYRALNLL